VSDVGNIGGFYCEEGLFFKESKAKITIGIH